MKNSFAGEISIKAERSSLLIANFVDGFAENWFMSVRESFRMELDIKQTERKKQGVSYYEWTQGPYFCFSEGQIFYDNRAAYTLPWQDAFQKIKLACQIVEAKPNIPLRYENEQTGKSSYMVFEGFVRFILHKPNDTDATMIPFACYQLSQKEFVSFLKNGKI